MRREAQKTFHERVSAMPREDLALMVTMGKELSAWEREKCMPMLCSDPEALRAWLLSGVSEFGVGRSSKKRRRASRAKTWCKLASAERVSGESYDGVWEVEDVYWVKNKEINLWVALRHAVFFCHWGVAMGGSRKGVNSYTSCMVHILWLVALELGLIANYKNAGVWWVSIAASFLLMRVTLWSASDKQKRHGFEACAALPMPLKMFWLWKAGKESEREQGQNFKSPSSLEELEGALLRASLGMAPTAVEKVEMEERARVEREQDAWLAEASNPDLVSSYAERDALSTLVKASANENALSNRL